jgi:alpha-1,3-rhamnosyl/mannosyltransferase
VIWLDYVERDQLRALYHAAGMFVFPSLSEGFGLPVLEAFACGLPVIASDLPALREVAGTRATWIEPGPADAIVDAIETLHDQDPDPAASALGREHARNFTWQSCAEKTLAVYRELMN